MQVPDSLKVFLIYCSCAFSQASIVTVIHLVNAVVDMVTEEGIVVCVFCVRVHSDCPWSGVLLLLQCCTKSLCDGSEEVEYFYAVQVCPFITQRCCKISLYTYVTYVYGLCYFFVVHSEFTQLPQVTHRVLTTAFTWNSEEVKSNSNYLKVLIQKILFM